MSGNYTKNFIILKWKNYFYKKFK